MKVKLLVFAAALLALTSLSFAQNFVACFYYDGSQLTANCDGTGGALPDGTPMVIYYDANSNGPDAADQPATVCSNPPDCADGPAGTVNFNTFVINSAEVGLEPGQFLSEPCFTSSGITPSPSRYYIKLTAANGLVWMSPVFTLAVGPQDVYCGPWTCTPPPPPTCTPIPDTRAVTFAPVSGNVQDQAACITLCHAYPTVTVCVGPTLFGRLPEVVASSNCQCDPHQAAGYTFDGSMAGPWVWNAATMSYCQQIVLGPNGTEGCVELHFDYILAARVTDVQILPRDNSVSVSFKTASETNMARYEVRRNGNVVARLDANNGSTEHSYSYTDNSAANGTTYTYELVSVSVDGSTNLEATQAVTPDQNHALVTEYALHQNFPNPFNPTTSIRFDLVENNFVSLKIYNANGQEVSTIVNGNRQAGVNVVNFDATNLTSGLYFYTVKVGNVYSATKKMLLVK
ncbi:MAG TPA: T9SS type A sorting domain-containing protein [bacterium]|jgi:hypothetical protein